MQININNREENVLKKFFFQDFFQSAVVQWTFIACIFLNIADWSFLLYFIRRVDFPIIIHYNVYFGVDIIGNWLEAYYLPLIGTGIMLVNTVLAYLFYVQKERIVTHLLMLASFIAQMSISVAVACIILINY